MLKLRGQLPMLQAVHRAPYLATVTSNDYLSPEVKQTCALLLRQGMDPTGFQAILMRQKQHIMPRLGGDVFELGKDYEYLGDGDIIRLDPRTGVMRCLYRRNSHHNTILLTEQCDHYCLMCSQPPKRIDDSWLLAEARELISLIPKETVSLGFSGGEPTLYGKGFLDLLHHAKSCLPTTAIDVLSNGRAFKNMVFARQYAAIQHPDLLIGIPIYSDDPVRHDYVVQSKGAFDETIRGILNLKALNQRVEIRIVIHRQTIDRLVKTCEFLARNLLFVDHVALMSLEITGFTHPNLEALWIDPYEYKDILSDAVAVLNDYGMHASVYNHQLCITNPDIWSHYRRSISDWKNEYLDECSLCKKGEDCGGFFSSSKKYQHSKYIRPFT